MTTTVTQEQGYTGLALKIPRVVTQSTLSQVTTAGWWNNNPINGQIALNPQDLVAICYSYGNSSLQATAIFAVSIGANGVVTLSLDAGSGIVLPTIANHIATYTNTSGTLSEDPATAISGGNIQAGLSGSAGTLASFPATASKGSFVVKGVANTGNTNTTLSNAPMGQESTINVPDPVNAVGQLLIGATATPFISGNFPENSGTAGLMVDSGVSVSSLSTNISNVSALTTQLGALHQVSVTFNTAAMVTAYDTPLQIVANPSASQMILVLQASVYTASTGHTAYATGTAPIIQYSSGGTNGAHGLGTIATATGLVAGDITAATSQVRNLFGIATGVQTGLSGLGLYFSNATGDYTGGTGTSITITVVYQLLTATV